MGSQDSHVHTHREATGESELYIMIMLSFSIQHMFVSKHKSRQESNIACQSLAKYFDDKACYIKCDMMRPFCLFMRNRII
jgi:hypothetical protein